MKHIVRNRIAAVATLAAIAASVAAPCFHDHGHDHSSTAACSQHAQHSHAHSSCGHHHHGHHHDAASDAPSPQPSEPLHHDDCSVCRLLALAGTSVAIVESPSHVDLVWQVDTPAPEAPGAAPLLPGRSRAPPAVV